MLVFLSELTKRNTKKNYLLIDYVYDSLDAWIQCKDLCIYSRAQSSSHAKTLSMLVGGSGLKPGSETVLCKELTFYVETGSKKPY